MAIPLTNLHKARVVEQLSRNLINLQSDMRRNATDHKAMIADNVDLAKVQVFVADCASQYLRRLQWVIDLRADAAKRARLLDVLTKMGWTEADITDVVSPLRQAAIALRDAPRTNAAEINAACDAVLATINPPDSLWPE